MLVQYYADSTESRQTAAVKPTTQSTTPIMVCYLLIRATHECASQTKRSRKNFFVEKRLASETLNGPHTTQDARAGPDTKNVLKVGLAMPP